MQIIKRFTGAALALLLALGSAQAQLAYTNTANDGSTGTTLGRTAKLTSSGAFVVGGTGDTTGLVGIVTNGAGTSNSPTVVSQGLAYCDFDGTPTANHYVQASTSAGGKCHDAGATQPTSGDILGRVLNATAVGGFYPVMVGITPSPGSGTGGVTIGAAVNGSCTNGFNLYSNGGVVGCQANGAGTLPLNYLGGCTLSNDGGTPNSIIDISACVVMDSTNAEYIPGLAAFTKSTAGSFATGAGSNGMGAGLTIANSTWYHVFAIDCSTGGAHGDIYFDTSVTAANIPACATKFRRLGSFKTDGSAHILAFKQRGDVFIWDAPNEAATNQTYTSTPATLTLTGNPPGVVTEALLQVYTGTTNDNALTLSDPTSSQTSGNGGPACGNSVGGHGASCVVITTTNTSSQVTVTAAVASAVGNYIRTVSYRDFRGQ